MELGSWGENRDLNPDYQERQDCKDSSDLLLEMKQLTYKGA